MSKFKELQVQKINRETAHSISIELAVPKELKADFQFKSGQYLTFKKTLNNTEIRRSYSICSAPHEQILKVGIKQVENGIFSTFANQKLAVGDVLDTMIPMGGFCPQINPNHAKNYMLFAAGSGITPLISIAKDILHSEKNSSVTLLYGNRTVEEIIFKEDLEDLKNKYIDRFVLHHVLSKAYIGNELNRGRLDAKKCDLLGRTIFDVASMDAFFICGPYEMAVEIKNWLIAQQVDASAIHVELFGAPNKTSKLTLEATKTSMESCSITIIKDGDTMQFDLENTNENILDAAYNLGMDIPFSCKGGVCCTCKAKLIEGEVQMLKNFSLEPQEVEQGYILTCQSIPKSNVIKVSFDE